MAEEGYSTAMWNIFAIAAAVVLALIVLGILYGFVNTTVSPPS